MSNLIFGIFDDFWDGHPNHLPFLNLYESLNDSREWNLQISINKLEAILAKNSIIDITEGLNLLLKSHDWRPHLIAALVILKYKELQGNGFTMALWERLKLGSWVSPQILVVLSLIDKDFEDLASEVLTNGFKVVYNPMSSVEHHTLRGAGGALITERKVISATQYLLNGILDEYNEGGGVAMGWKKRLLELIKEQRFSME